MAKNMPNGALNEPPLSLVLTAIKYQAEPAWNDDLIKNIRTKMRNEFPIYVAERQPEIQLGSGIQLGPGVVQVQTPKQETFLTEDRRRGFSISNGLVAIFDSHYRSYNEFSEFVKNILDVLYCEIPITMYQRLGLRFIDTILPSNEKKVDSYIVPQLRKFVPEMLKREPQATHSRYAYESSVGGSLVLQAYHVPMGEPVPPDLQNVTKNLDLRFGPQSSNFFMLDTDHYLEYPDVKRFNLNEVMELLDKLHIEADELFFSSVTEEAIAQWNG